MSQYNGTRYRGESSRYVKKPTREEPEIIKVPAFDYSDLIEKFKLTLVGRMFHKDGRSVDALLKHMPRRRIWDVKGRVRGTNLGNNKFQLDFDKEEDLQKVLNKRPCHFNKWSFSLERWIPTIKEDFPNNMTFWVEVERIPSHYKKEQTFWSIGKALGIADKVDVQGNRLRVSINGDDPIHLERKIGFDNGDVVAVTLKYEDLHRYCYTCRRISHEEGTCPELNEDQRERNRITRLEAKEKEEIANREAFSIPLPRKEGRAQSPMKDMYRSMNQRESEKRYQRLSPKKDSFTEKADLRNLIAEKRALHFKNV